VVSGDRTQVDAIAAMVEAIAEASASPDAEGSTSG
jgi:hypothetical protein